MYTELIRMPFKMLLLYRAEGCLWGEAWVGMAGSSRPAAHPSALVLGPLVTRIYERGRCHKGLKRGEKAWGAGLWAPRRRRSCSGCWGRGSPVGCGEEGVGERGGVCWVTPIPHPHNPIPHPMTLIPNPHNPILHPVTPIAPHRDGSSEWGTAVEPGKGEGMRGVSWVCFLPLNSINWK